MKLSMKRSTNSYDQLSNSGNMYMKNGLTSGEGISVTIDGHGALPKVLSGRLV